jgi:hypothetical protein
VEPNTLLFFAGTHRIHPFNHSFLFTFNKRAKTPYYLPLEKDQKHLIIYLWKTDKNTLLSTFGKQTKTPYYQPLENRQKHLIIIHLTLYYPFFSVQFINFLLSHFSLSY